VLIDTQHPINLPGHRKIEAVLRDQLLSRLKEKLPDLNALLAEMESNGGIENKIYQFYQHSFKVYEAQAMTEEAVELLQSLLPERPLNAEFRHIVSEGTGQTFELSHNEDWLQHTRPMVEALFHAHYFVKMACKSGQELETQPDQRLCGLATSV
jgi:hypothetical protein